MKNPEDSIEQLFALARQARPEPVGNICPHLQTRVLAHCRSSQSAGETTGSLNLLLRRATVCAALLMLASIIWSYSAAEFQLEEDLALANLELREDVMP